MKTLKVLIAVFVVLSIVLFVLMMRTDTMYVDNEEATTTPKLIHMKSELDKAIEDVMSREAFQKKMESEAKRIALQEKKEQLTREYEDEMAKIEQQLESLRDAELSLE